LQLHARRKEGVRNYSQGLAPSAIRSRRREAKLMSLWSFWASRPQCMSLDFTTATDAANNPVNLSVRFNLHPQPTGGQCGQSSRLSTSLLLPLKRQTTASIVKMDFNISRKRLDPQRQCGSVNFTTNTNAANNCFECHSDFMSSIDD